MAEIYCGIDIGKAGGIVAVKNGAIVHQSPMPLVGGETVDVKALEVIINTLRSDHGMRIHAIFERFSGFFGYAKKSAISVAYQAGFIEGFLVITNVPHTGVIPRVWQKEMFSGTRELKNSDGKRDTKKMAMMAASKLFPGESFVPTTRHKVPHNGLIDAALLALYAERKRL